jgi:hypothetical protein
MACIDLDLKKKYLSPHTHISTLDVSRKQESPRNMKTNFFCGLTTNRCNQATNCGCLLKINEIKLLFLNSDGSGLNSGYSFGSVV